MGNNRNNIAHKHKRSRWEQLKSSHARELAQAHIKLENPQLLAVIRIRHECPGIHLVEVATSDFLKGDTEAHRPVVLRTGSGLQLITHIYLSNLISIQYSIRNVAQFSRWMSHGDAIWQRIVAGERVGDRLIGYTEDCVEFRK